MPAPVGVQTPLDALAALQDGVLRLVEPESSSGKKVSALLLKQGAAPALVAQIAAWEETNLDVVQLPGSDVRLFVHSEGTAHCAEVVAVAKASSGNAIEIPIGGLSDPSFACSVYLSGGAVNGTPAILIEEDGAFTPAYTHSNIWLYALHGHTFDPPCSVKVRYTVAFRTQHAYCNGDGVDCALLMQKADASVAQRDAGATAESLGTDATASWSPKMNADYRVMAELAQSAHDSMLPTFGASFTGFVGFRDDVVFPISLDNGTAYIARLGHGSMGWRESAGYLMAVYKLGDNQLVPVAGLAIEPRRSRIVSVETH
jgi:hypothetical protein